MTMGTLYDLTQECNRILDAIMEAGEGDDIALLLDKMWESEEDWKTKVESYARMVLELGARAEAAEKEAERLTKRKRRCEATIDALKGRMLYAMQSRGLKKADTDIGCWHIRKNAPSVEIIDAAKIPAAYLVAQEPKVSKAAILAAYKQDGEIVPGTEIVQRESVSFK
jgi:hypothetical protein